MQLLLSLNQVCAECGFPADRVAIRPAKAKLGHFKQFRVLAWGDGFDLVCDNARFSKIFHHLLHQLPTRLNSVENGQQNGHQMSLRRYG